MFPSIAVEAVEALPPQVADSRERTEECRAPATLGPEDLPGEEREADERDEEGEDAQHADPHLQTLGSQIAEFVLKIA